MTCIRREEGNVEGQGMPVEKPVPGGRLLSTPDMRGPPQVLMAPVSWTPPFPSLNPPRAPQVVRHPSATSYNSPLAQTPQTPAAGVNVYQKQVAATRYDALLMMEDAIDRTRKSMRVECICGNVFMPDSNFCRKCGLSWHGCEAQRTGAYRQ